MVDKVENEGVAVVAEEKRAPHPSMGHPKPRATLGNKRKRGSGLRGQRLERYNEDRCDRFSTLRSQGFSPPETMRIMDEQDGRVRSESMRCRDSQWLESNTMEFRSKLLNAEDLSDAEFEKFYDQQLARIAYFPKQSSSFALTAFDRIKARRDEKLFGSPEAASETLDKSFNELMRLLAITTGAQKRFGQWAAGIGWGHQDAMSGGSGDGSTGTCPPKGEVGRKAGLVATLGVLKGFCSQQGEMLKVAAETVERLTALETATSDTASVN